jgi:hypothetical protein
MTWKPVSLTELNEIVERELMECSDEQRAYFKTVAFEPTKWRQSPYGTESGGFWAIAADENRVVWYNDYEEGFNVSAFTTLGTIPDDEYWCNQDSLQIALAELMTGINSVGKWGPPLSLTAGLGTSMRHLWEMLKRLTMGRSV